MIELKLSPFNPGKMIVSNEQFYHIYKDGKIVNRNLYTKLGLGGKTDGKLLVLNKRTVTEIEPKILDACREKYPKYPKYHMSDDIVVVSGDTGEIIFDTNDSHFDNIPIVISDYMFSYKNSLYDNQGNVLGTFIYPKVIENNKVYIIQSKGLDGNGIIYVYSKKGELLKMY